MNEEVQDKIQQGVELMAAGRYEDAAAAFEGALGLDRGNYEAHFNLGNARVNLGQLDEGMECFRKALLAKPGSGEARYSLGCALFLANRGVEAVREFNRCEESGFAPVEMYQILQTIFVDADDPVQAIRYANKAIALEPLNPQHYIDKAQLYLLREQPREAVACLREVEELLPDAAEPYIVESQIYLQSGESDEALASVERALSRFPDDPGLTLVKGRVLNEAGRCEEALPVLERARKLAAGDDELARSVDLQAAVAQAGVRDLDASIASLERAVAADPGRDEAMFLLITECAAAKRFEDAERHADEVLTGGLDVDARTKATAVYWKAASMRELGREEDARSAFREAVGVLRRITIANPGLVEVYAYRLMCHKELGEYDKALELADHIIHLAPEDATGYAFKSEVLAAKGDEEGAATMRAKALELKPDFRF